MKQIAKSSQSHHVWYACYGSNLCKERFMKYINHCTDRTPPIEDRPFLLKHPIYFAKSASGWQNGGKAFLDDSSEGLTYGRIYKITKEQYQEVKCMEGRDYKKHLPFGEIDGIPVHSFTDEQKNVPSRTPSNEYFAKILEGLRECYGEEQAKIIAMTQIIPQIFPKNTFVVARAIREYPHSMTNAEIGVTTGFAPAEVTSATAWLLDHNVIQQHKRSTHPSSDPDAFFFTVDSPCARDLLDAIHESLFVG